MNQNPLVGIVMGSSSDLETMKLAQDTLAEFGVPSEMRILSAHRVPEETAAWAAQAEKRGLRILITAAGMANHLSGTVAARSLLPVIGVPLLGGVASGVDSLLSTVQMPKGVPVGTMAVGRAGAINAALLAIRILALQDGDLRAKLAEYSQRLANEVLQSDARLRA